MSADAEQCFSRVQPEPRNPPEPDGSPKLTKPQNPPAADSAAGSNPAESDVTKSGESCRQERREIPGIESINDPLKEPPRNMQGDGANLFQSFWAAWPRDERPRNKGLVEALFLKLSPHERRLAVQYAKAYRVNQKARGAFGLMILYLKQKLFLEFKGGPLMDAGGDFIITPEREEWRAWLNYINTRHGPTIADHAEKHEKLLVKTRWPEVLQEADKQNENDSDIDL